MSDQIIREIKVLVIGDGGVGKTTFIKRHVTGEFDRKYIATIGAEVTKVDVMTNIGMVRFQLQDSVGSHSFGCLRDNMGADAAIIMSDLTSRNTYKNIPGWYKDITRICETIPTVIVGNKVDITDRKVKPQQIKYPKRKNLPYFEISCKANYQMDQPLIQILKSILGNETLFLTQEIALQCCGQYQFDDAFIQYLEQQLKEAQEIKLPDDDDFL